MTCGGCREGMEPDFALCVAFQPIVDLELGRPYAYEALIRGPHGESAGWVLSQVNDDNRYAFDQACRVAAIRNAVAAGLLDTDARLAINFLPNAVYSPFACIQSTLKTARETGLPVHRLIFEFVESERMNTVHTATILDAYRALGFSTALDDFGAGHAGLNLLADMETDIVKIDMGLVRGIDTDRARQTIMASTIGLLRDMGRMVVVEGIETAEELATLRAMGVRYVQGYYLAKPEIAHLPDLAPGTLAALTMSEVPVTAGDIRAA